MTARLRGVAVGQRGARKRRAHQVMQIPVRHGAHPLEAIELDVIRGARRRLERCGPEAYRVRHLAMSNFCVHCLVLFLILITRFVTLVV